MAAVQSVLLFAVCVLMITELIVAKKDYYDILGVSRGATERQIKKAFHRLAMKFHPDKNKNPDAEVRFREIAEAYEVLSDEGRRRKYDQFGDNAYFTGETQKPGSHQPFTFNFDDMFKDFNIYSQNRHSRHRRHFEEHSRSHNRNKRHFQGGFGAGMLDDMFDDMDRMFTFDRHSKQTEGRFHGATKQHCRTVTQRRGNMVTTYTDCTAS
ncbi:dnaJ homolog subfamily B member 9a [Cyprinodon tularosa]|uniref:dnaJ homolog subfamily B member 9a n=1 Tax=Cyprinodon tularosa TaxID=77115 RepID=UPI0018E1F3D2|nr:dnaJ homolog subfamily B member 9a [Cyprinodon tularosa]